MSEYIIDIPDDCFASYDTERDMYYPDERDSAMPIVPIVRCRDCKYYDDEPDLESSEPKCWRDPEHRGQSVWTSPDRFCAWGERKTC